MDFLELLRQEVPAQTIEWGFQVTGAVNETMTRFGYPETLIKEYAHWAVLLRPAQVTLGSLVLVCNEPATAFSGISAAAAAEMKTAVDGIEGTLAAVWPYDKINYLMLMMVDPNVHFHVIPRYEKDQHFEGRAYSDAGWPKLPDLGAAVTLEPTERDALITHLRDRWRD